MQQNTYTCCACFLQWLVERARILIQIYVDSILKASDFLNREICGSFDDIVRRISQQSETTEELVKQQTYVDNLELKELILLKVNI